jgi:hypothetical protein
MGSVTETLTRDPALDALLPALLVDDPDEQAVTDALLIQIDVTARLEQLVDGLAALLEAATSPQTRRAYESDFAHFASWTGAHGLASLPAAPQTVALYIAAQQDHLRPATVVRRLSAIAVRH